MPAAMDSSGNVAPDLAAVGIAVLALLVDERESRVANQPDAVPTEVLLGDVGLTSTQIAKLVRKAPGSVRAAQSRAKKPPTKSRR